MQKQIPVFHPRYHYDPHPAQALFHAAKERFRTMIAGRKFGKTEMIINEVVDWAGVPESMIWWLSPQYSVSEIAWYRMNQYLNPDIIKSRNKRDREIILINNSRIAFKSGDSEKGLVGEGLDFCAVEEAPLVDEMVWTRSVRPNLGDQDRAGHAAFFGCVTEDTLVVHDGQITPIIDLKPETQDRHENSTYSLEVNLLGKNGYNKTSHYKCNGLTETLKIEADNGASLEGTYDHPIWSIRNNEEQWIKLEDLSVGDHVAFKKCMDFSDRLIHFDNGKIIWVKIKQITPSMNETFDVHIPHDHSFISNGFISHNTPRGLNWVYREWQKGQSKDFPDYRSWSFRLLQMPITGELVESYEGGFPSWVNPYWPRKELLDVIHSPRLIFLEEYGARFLESLSNIFTGIDYVVDQSDDSRFEEMPRSGEEYVIGYDIARSGAGDNAVIAVVDSTNRLVFMDTMRGRGFQYQMDWVIELAERYNSADIVVDSTANIGDPIVELLADRYRYVLPYYFTKQSKRALIDNFSIQIQTKNMSIPSPRNETECGELLKEMRVFGAERTPQGEIKYGAPPGFKDDRVIGISLALWGNTKEKARAKLNFKFITL